MPYDDLVSVELTLGRKWLSSSSFGVLGAESWFLKSSERSQTIMGFVSVGNESGLRYFVGLGIYESTRIERGLISAFGLKWSGGKSFSIR